MELIINIENKIYNKADTVDVEQIRELNRTLGINVDEQLARNLIMYPEHTDCIDAGLDFYGRNALLNKTALHAWQKMNAAAEQDNVKLFICSAYRTYAYQFKLIKNKLDRGQIISEIIKVLAPPGFSEHHTGCAIDIMSPELPELDQTFEDTKAFAWLETNAINYNFVMSYPRNNPYSVIYEPWHWCYKPVL